MTLTKRQKQVLRFTALDMPQKQIAQAMGCSIKTVEHHRHMVRKKFKCGLAGLVLLAVRERLINV